MMVVRDELTTVHANASSIADIWEFHQFVTELEQRVEDANLNNEMSVSVRQQVAGMIYFVVFGAILMATLNIAAAFEDVADRLNV